MKIITKTSIQQNLRTLDSLYRSAIDPKKCLFYSKLAILELCGWTEETMDKIVRSCAKRTLKNSTNIKNVEDSVIRRTHGFEYNDHFRRMLIQVIGLHGVEVVEHHVDTARLQTLKSTLGALKSRRDTEAHTHLIATTRTLDAPSVTLQNFNLVYEGLNEIMQKLRSCGY
jgi:hypothetical protein